MPNGTTSVRDDGRTRETAAFLDLGDRSLFTITNAPSGRAPTSTLLVLSPIGGDHETNYRREVLLARELARQGLGTTRFHYAGTANSTGDPAALAIGTMLDDARAVAADLPGGRPAAVLGTRLSALPAAALAATAGVPRLVLWDPTPSGRIYFRQLSRTLSARQMSAYSRREAEDDRSMADQMSADGVASVAGYSVPAALYDSCQGPAISDVELGRGTEVDIVLFGGSRAAAFDPIAAGWRAGGADVRITVLDESEKWWFTPEDVAEEERPLSRQAVELTRDLVLSTSPVPA